CFDPPDDSCSLHHPSPTPASTLPLHDALPIYGSRGDRRRKRKQGGLGPRVICSHSLASMTNCFCLYDQSLGFALRGRPAGAYIWLLVRLRLPLWRRKGSLANIVHPLKGSRTGLLPRLAAKTPGPHSSSHAVGQHGDDGGEEEQDGGGGKLHHDEPAGAVEHVRQRYVLVEAGD